MTRYDHYREAERLLQQVDERRASNMNTQLIAQAQVHATLATVEFDGA